MRLPDITPDKPLSIEAQRAVVVTLAALLGNIGAASFARSAYGKKLRADALAALRLAGAEV